MRYEMNMFKLLKPLGQGLLRWDTAEEQSWKKGGMSWTTSGYI